MDLLVAIGDWVLVPVDVSFPALADTLSLVLADTLSLVDSLFPALALSLFRVVAPALGRRLTSFQVCWPVLVGMAVRRQVLLLQHFLA